VNALPVEMFRCPACAALGLTVETNVVSCPACGKSYSREGGFIDMLDASLAGEPLAATPEQKLMESELIARLYERFWRPTFVRLFAGGGASAMTGGFGGEFFIHKNALAMEDHEGPWLDLSCGPGTFTRAMAAACPGEWVIGLDISKAMLDVAARRARGYGNVVLLRADAHELPFGNETLGGVNVSGALHAYDDPEAVFSEVRRILRPGGIFVGSTFAQSPNLVGGTLARIAGIRRYQPTELRAWLSRIGLADYEEIRLGGAFIFRVRRP
jgi:SAM-dependent methyltransferase